MAQFFNMPQPGSTMEEGTILKWNLKEGDTFHTGDILLEIETDKATVEIEAESDGALLKILEQVNAVVPVRQPIAIIGSPNEDISALIGQLSGSGGISPAPSEITTPSPEEAASVTASLVGDEYAGGRLNISPRARRAAEENGIAQSELSGIGTGPGGRIVERDILALVEKRIGDAGTGGKQTPRATPLAARMADELGVDLQGLAAGLPGNRVRREDVLKHLEETETPKAPVSAAIVSAPASAGSDVGYSVTPLAGMRKRIADNIVKSRFGAPHVTLTLEVDMTAASELRKRLIPEVEKAYGSRLSFTDLIVKAVARTLADFPQLNSALVGDEIRTYTAKNIGVAVALDAGLVVPVVQNADIKTIGQVSAELKALVDRCRTGKFTPTDLEGGTFTITNLGGFGIDVFDPVIVPPQAAILGVCRIAEKPVVVEGAIVIRSMMNLCLSFDHRILDGAPAARFLQKLKELLESPFILLV